MNAFTRFTDDTRDDLHEQIHALRKELARVKKDVSRRGAGAYRESRHVGDELTSAVRDYLEDALPRVRHGADVVTRTARRRPVTSAATAALGLVVIGLAVSLLVRR